ncbi:MAG: tail fiber domain-containing protein [Chitinophagales bacterium]
MKKFLLQLIPLVLISFILNAQNVGIGTPLPSEKLHVIGAGYFHNDIGAIKIDNVANEPANGYVRSSIVSSRDGDLEWDAANDQWTLGSGSNNDFTAIMHSSQGELAFFTGGNNAFSTLSNTDFRNQFQHMTINSAGNVGIGIINPASYKLYVAGNARLNSLNINGAYDFPTNAGAANYVLKSDGAGNLVWDDANNLVNGDNLGDHTATQTLNLNGNDINNIESSIYNNTETSYHADINGRLIYDQSEGMMIYDDYIGGTRTGTGWARIWDENNFTSLDGSGSGLDADLLDGQNGPYYLDNTDNQNLSNVLGVGNSAGSSKIINMANPTNDQDAATKKYVDDQLANGDDWDKTGDDIYNNNAGNVGIGEDTPLQSLEVVGNVVQGNGSNLIIAALESRVPVPSIKKASEVSFSGSNANYPNLVGESDPCSGLVTWAAAKAHAEAQGGRLPTVDEVLSNVAEGSGCGYDSEYVWTQTKCGYNSYFVAPGDNISLSTLPVECRSATATANTRFVAEVDKGNLPAITDGEGALRTDKIKARVGNGIEFVDDNDNIGIALLDGGDLRFDNYTNGFLQVDGSGNVSSVATIPSGSINEVDPTWNGTASTGSDINRSGRVLLNGGSAATDYSNASVALEIDHAGDGTAGLQMNGTTSAYRIGIQDGFGRVHHYWNAYDSGSDHRYDVSSEPATWMETGSGAGFEFSTAPSGTAGDIISWDLGLKVDDGRVGVAGGTNGSYELYVNGKIGSNGINETSDERLKKDIQPLENALEVINALEGVSYYWRVDEFPDKNFSDRKEIGVIAQEVEKILPEVVDTDSEGYKSVQYSHLVPILIEALKEVSNELELLKDHYANRVNVKNCKIDHLENDVEQLKSEMRELKMMIEMSAQK